MFDKFISKLTHGLYKATGAAIETSAYDELLVSIAEYVHSYNNISDDIFAAAKLSLLDSMACALLALEHPQCRRMLGALVPGTVVPNGARVPGTNFVLDPIKAAFDFGSMIRWLDFNDTWLAQEWGHPSDNLGGILMLADHLAQQDKNNQSNFKKLQNLTNTTLTMREVLTALIKAYEIQGVLALANAFNQVGLDHVLLVKVASAAVAAKLLGADQQQICAAISHAWIDGHSLRIYRHGNQTSARKSWAAGDATARGVQLAWLVMRGDQAGFSQALSDAQWGFCKVLFNSKPVVLSQPLATYVMDNILYKVKYPAEFHAQTAVEAAIKLHSAFKNQINDNIANITRIEIATQSSAMRIINKQGKLRNYADRDHCLQYMVASALLYGTLDANHYTDQFAAADPRLDQLREKMVLTEDLGYSRAYLAADQRAIPNAIQIFFADGSSTEKVEILYPLGHRCRRAEALPELKQKYTAAIHRFFAAQQAVPVARSAQSKQKQQELKQRQQQLLNLWELSVADLLAMPIEQYIQLWV